MKKIKLRISGNVIEVTERPEIITSGTIGLPVEFSFDSQWDGLSKIAMFRAGEKVIVITDPDREIAVPWEVLEKAHEWLSIGIYGVNEYGTVVIPTMWVDVAKIHIGANPEGDETTDPTLPVWVQIQSQLDHLTPEAIGAAPMSYAEPAIDELRESVQEMQITVANNETAMNNHRENTENPHGVTAEQVGAVTPEKAMEIAGVENAPIIVTLDETGVASHLPETIYDAIRSGKTVFLLYQGYIYPCVRCDQTFAEFATFNYESDCNYWGVRIEGDGTFNVFSKTMAPEDFVYFKVDEHAQDQNNPHGVTAAQAGAAPAGYGLGEDSPRTTAWDSQSRSGFYKSSNNSPDGTLWYGVTCSSSTGRQAQIAFSPEFDIGLIEARRYKNGSNIGEWEYVNPPMLEGVEYRTIERRNGKAVYKKLVGDVIYWRVDGSEEWKQ